MGRNRDGSVFTLAILRHILIISRKTYLDSCKTIRPSLNYCPCCWTRDLLHAHCHDSHEYNLEFALHAHLAQHYSPVAGNLGVQTSQSWNYCPCCWTRDLLHAHCHVSHEYNLEFALYAHLARHYSPVAGNLGVQTSQSRMFLSNLQPGKHLCRCCRCCHLPCFHYPRP